MLTHYNLRENLCNCVSKNEYLHSTLYVGTDISFDRVLRHFVKWDKVPLTIGQFKLSISQNRGNKSVLLKGSNLHPGTKAGPLAKKKGCISIASLL